jgi:hypothetical protein
MIAKLRSTRLGKLGMTAGAVVLTVIAIDVIATAVTLAAGWRFFSR